MGSRLLHSLSHGSFSSPPLPFAIESPGREGQRSSCGLAIRARLKRNFGDDTNLFVTQTGNASQDVY
jgi:hypothetical protein